MLFITNEIQRTIVILKGMQTLLYQMGYHYCYSKWNIGLVIPNGIPPLSFSNGRQHCHTKWDTTIVILKGTLGLS